MPRGKGNRQAAGIEELLLLLLYFSRYMCVYACSPLHV